MAMLRKHFFNDTINSGFLSLGGRLCRIFCGMPERIGQVRILSEPLCLPIFFLNSEAPAQRSGIKAGVLIFFRRILHLNNLPIITTISHMWEGDIKSSGNFMLQALLALALVISFLPMFVKKVAGKNLARENAAVVSQIMSAFDAARAFVYEEFDNLPDGIKTFDGDEFVQKLEPYGLPLGFVPFTPIGQSISLVISKNGKNIFSVLDIAGGKLSELRRAEILARIGFWGVVIDENGTARGATGGWETAKLPNGMILNSHSILMRVPEDDEFSELVARNAKDPSKNIFHADLKMDGNNITVIRNISANTGKIKNIAATDFILSGIEADKKNKNDIGVIRADKVWFSSSDGNPLTIVRSDLKTGRFSAASIANYGDLPALTAATMTMRDFNMTAGRTGFTGPPAWDINTTASFTNITLSVEKLSVSSFLDTSRGQDVFLNADDPSQLEYQSGSGVRADVMKTDNIILRDQISSDLLAGGTGAALIEIRTGGTSVLPDVLLSEINNDSLMIPQSATDNSGKTEPCRNIIARIGGKYDASSLANSIICRFVMYNRIEHRIEIKKCLLNGGTNCI